MSKFDTIYNEALKEANYNPNPQQQTNTQQTTPKQTPKLDTGVLTNVMKKWGEAKKNNTSLNLTPQEQEALDQLLGGSVEQVSNNQQQTNTPPVVNTPQPNNKPQVSNKPAI